MQRAIARWAAGRACTLAGPATLAWVAPALDAVERGQDLPPPFNDPELQQLLFADINELDIDGKIDVHHRVAAVGALTAAADADPLRAAVGALYLVAVHSRTPEEHLDAVRRAFPAMDTPTDRT